MEFAIKVGEEYYKELEVNEIIFSKEPVYFSSLSITSRFHNVLEFMRFGDIPKNVIMIVPKEVV